MEININDLRKVQGIGEKTIQRIKEQFSEQSEYASEYNPEEHLAINEIHHGDCLDLMNGIPDKSIDMIVTDPPYKVTSKGNAGNSGGMLKKTINKKGQVFKHNDIEINQWLPILYRVLKDKGHCYIMTNHKNLKNYLNVAEDIGFHFIKSIVWDKGNKIMGHYYMSQFEYILFFRKGGGRKINNCGTSDIISIPNKKTKNQYGKNIHDTEKPVDLMRILIENSSNVGEVVLDPFVGSGTTPIACIDTNRNFIGIELDKEYYEVAKKRIQEESSKPKQKNLMESYNGN